jgi:hypothetical protein
MKQAYIVTECQFDATMLHRLLPKHIVKFVKFVPDKYSASSRAMTILSVRQRPLAFVVEATARTKTAVLEREDMARYIIRRGAGDVPFKIFTPFPSIEMVFFQDRALLEQLIGRKINDLEWKFATFNPKEVLNHLLEGHPEGLTIEGILDTLTDEAIEVLQKHPFICSISEFLASAMDKQL